MNKQEMKEILLSAFKQSSYEHYIQKGWILPDDFNSFSLGIEKIHLNTSPSFEYKGTWVSVDFAAGAGCKVGIPTNKIHITVFYRKDPRIKEYQFVRFTFKQFIAALWDRMNTEKNVEQLVLF